MRILFLAARLPYPLDTGAKIRAYHILKGLASEHEVTMLAFYSSENELEKVEMLSKLGVRVIPVLNEDINRGVSPRFLAKSLFSRLPITVQKYQSKVFRKELALLLKDNFDVVHCEHLHVAHYVGGIKDCRRVLDAHNVEAEIVERMRDVERNPFKRALLAWHLQKTRSFENKVVREFDLVLAVSSKDQATLENISGKHNVSTVENGVDINYFKSNGVGKNNALVFVGSMDWLPNVDGVKYFAHEIFPLIQKEAQSIKFSIVGKNPPSEIVELARKNQNIIVTGAVDDVRPYIDEASVYVVPLRFGGGTRLKVLEAFAMGKAVISTTLGSEGIDYKDREHLLIADSPERFAEQVILLMRDQDLNAQLGASARQLAEKIYSWNVIEGKLTRHYSDLADRN